jgi:hypothetical protein
MLGTKLERNTSFNGFSHVAYNITDIVETKLAAPPCLFEVSVAGRDLCRPADRVMWTLCQGESFYWLDSSSSMVLQPSVGPWPLFQFRNPIYTVGRTPLTGNQPVARPLPTHRTAQSQNKRIQTSMYRVGFEPTIPEFERTKRVPAVDRAATVIGLLAWSMSLPKCNKPCQRLILLKSAPELILILTLEELQ